MSRLLQTSSHLTARLPAELAHTYCLLRFNVLFFETLNEEAVEQSSAPELGLVDLEWSKICLLAV